MIVNKQFQVKIYASNGSTFLRTLKPSEIKNSPTFTSQINGGFGECVLQLSLPFDAFGEGVSIDFMNIVKIYAMDEDNKDGRLIYTGFISSYRPYIDGAKQGVDVTLLGLVSLLSFAYYKNGSSFTVSQSAKDPAFIVKAIIDHFNTIYAGSLLGYDSGSTTVDTVGTNVTYNFVDRKWNEALEDTFGLAGAGWWWAIDKQGQLYLKQKPASATHTFTIGKDIDHLEVEKSSEKVINMVQVRYTGGATYDASDATSITDFGRREEIVSDTNIQNVGTATQRANQEVNDNKVEKIKARMIINASYDLETIKVGDTCKIQNLIVGQSIFSNNMQIVTVDYAFNQVTIELEEMTRFAKELQTLIA